MSRVSLGSRLGFGCAARQGRSARAQHDRGTRQEEVQVLQVQVKHLELKEQKGLEHKEEEEEEEEEGGWLHC